jgi:hypothetical protein
MERWMKCGARRERVSQGAGCGHDVAWKVRAPLNRLPLPCIPDFELRAFFLPQHHPHLDSIALKEITCGHAFAAFELHFGEVQHALATGDEELRIRAEDGAG